MALLWAPRIGSIRTPMPITNAELSSINAAPVTNNAVEPLEPLRSAELTLPVAMRLPTPYARKPARKRTPTIRAVRRTLESGRTTGREVAGLEVEGLEVEWWAAVWVVMDLSFRGSRERRWAIPNAVRLVETVP